MPDTTPVADETIETDISELTDHQKDMMGDEASLFDTPESVTADADTPVVEEDTDKPDGLADGDEETPETPDVEGEEADELPSDDGEVASTEDDTETPDETADMVAETQELREKLAHAEGRLAGMQDASSPKDVAPKVASVFDFAKAETEMRTANLDGDITKESEIALEIQNERDKIRDIDIEKKIELGVAQGIENQKYQETLVEAYRIYPQLDNRNSSAYDAELTQNIADMATVYMKRGSGKSEALINAVNLLIPSERVETEASIKPAPPAPKTKVTQKATTLTAVPQVASTNASEGKYAHLDSLKGDDFDQAVGKMSEQERNEWLKAG